MRSILASACLFMVFGWWSIPIGILLTFVEVVYEMCKEGGIKNDSK